VSDFFVVRDSRSKETAPSPGALAMVRRSARAVLFALIVPFAAVAARASTITISGNVYDGNGGPLLRGNVYHVVGSVLVPAGQTLSIESGVVVKFGAGLSMEVDGILSAPGNDTERIAFTSLKDDNEGGDTNQDGSASSPSPGDWRGLWFTGTSDGSTITYAKIKYGSTSNGKAAIELTNTQVVFDHLQFSDCSWSGLTLDAGNSNNDATVSNCEFVRCAQPLVGVALDYLTKLTDNTSTDCTNGDYARMVGTDDNFHADADLSPSNLMNGVLAGGFTVPNGITVRFEAGCVIKLGGPPAFWAINLFGTLELAGQAGNEVVITSFHDDTIGGDLDDDGGATAPSPTDWGGIATSSLFGAKSHLNADHARFRYGGNVNFGMLMLGGRTDATLRDCTIDFSYRDAIDLGGSVAPIVIERCAMLNGGGLAVDAAVLSNLPGLLDNTASGNAANYVRVTSSNVDSSPVISIGPRNCIGSTLVLSIGFGVPFKQTLELLPGTVLKFEKGLHRIEGSGALRFVGTAEEPIVLTSLRDDAIGGDTNQDGTTTQPAPGDWDGVTLPPNADASQLEHVVLRYGGAGQTQLRCRESKSIVRSLRSEFSKLGGIYAEAHNGAARNWIAVGCKQIGLELGGGAFDVLNATVTGNGGVGVKRANGWTGTLRSSIDWGNAGGAFSNFSGNEVFFCDGGFAGSNGNVDVDPLFVDAPNGDLSLQSTSPCVETGDPADVPSGTDSRGLPRCLDANFDRAMRVDMGACEFGHVQITASGDFTPGGTVTLTSTGTPGLPALMFIGFAETDALFKPYGRLFVDLSQPWLLVGWPPSPATVTDTLPASITPPLLVVFQEVVLSGRAGNLSNLARMQIE
jgi:hypothetical protein